MFQYIHFILEEIIGTDISVENRFYYLVFQYIHLEQIRAWKYFSMANMVKSLLPASP